MNFVLDFVIWIIHLLKCTLFYFFALSYHAGSGLLRIFNGAVCILQDIFTVVVIVKDEMFRFYCEVKETIADTMQYAHGSANSSIQLLLDTLVLILQHIVNFITSTKVHTRLLATSVGTAICNLVCLLRDAVYLLADSCWWLLMLLPRTLLQLVVSAIDFLVLLISGTAKMSLLMANDLMQNIFRWMLCFALFMILYMYRRYVLMYLLRLLVITVNETYDRLHWLRQVSRRIKYKISQVRRKFQKPNIIYFVDNGEGLPNATLCITCCDRAKCILLLPCKHLCLCQECKDYMYTNSDSVHCPICRTPIDNFMFVYT